MPNDDFDSGDHLYRDTEETNMPNDEQENAPDRIWFGEGLKLNVGQYESVSIDLGVSSAIREDETIADAMKRVRAEVTRELTQEALRVREGKYKKVLLMSWWVYLEDVSGLTVSVERHAEGGTHCLGGTEEAELNVTYNYGKFFDFGSLHQKRAGDMVELMERKVAELGTVRHPDYWEPTRGNAGHAISILLAWAKQHPNAVFRVS